MASAAATPHAHGHAGHDDHGHDHVEFLESLNPPPSYWPAALAGAMLFLPVGALLSVWGVGAWHYVGWASALLGLVLSTVAAMGWCHSVIVDKWMSHFGPVAQGRDLVQGTLLFFISEIAIFGSLFAYYFVLMFSESAKGNWPMEGTPHIHVWLPAIGLFLLLASSVTCEFAHKAILKGKRGLCKDWLIVTMALGLIFLFIQGWEWGWLIYHYGFTVGSNTFGTVFYILTGFHGTHVMTGLIMLMLVYGRLEIGHYSPERHFSLMAASWYWHLVDVVWVFVFVFVYCFVAG